MITSSIKTIYICGVVRGIFILLSNALANRNGVGFPYLWGSILTKIRLAKDNVLINAVFAFLSNTEEDKHSNISISFVSFQGSIQLLAHTKYATMGDCFQNWDMSLCWQQTWLRLYLLCSTTKGLSQIWDVGSRKSLQLFAQRLKTLWHGQRFWI